MFFLKLTNYLYLTGPALVMSQDTARVARVERSRMTGSDPSKLIIRS